MTVVIVLLDSVPSSRPSESLIDSDVEEKKCNKGKDAQKKGSCYVQVVLDVKRIVPK